MIKPIRLLLLLLLLCANCFAQTNPVAQALPYSQTFTGLAAASTTYPSGWQGWNLSAAGPNVGGVFRTSAPIADVTLTASQTAASTTGGVLNYNGKIGMLATATLDPAICLAISTVGITGTKVTYDIMTIRNPYNGTTQTRINRCGIQYRVGTAGVFTDLPGYEYRNNTTTQMAGIVGQNSVTKVVTLPAACDNQAVVQLRWVACDSSGAGTFRPSFALDNISISNCPGVTTTYYYRSFATGNWSNPFTWEASPNGVSGWVTACSAPTSAAASITIQSGHTVTIDAAASAPDLTVNNGGVLTANNTTFVTLTEVGNIINNGTFQMKNGAKGVDIVFTKNGGQTVTGTGATTNFYSIGLNMGASNGNVLDISSTNFTSGTVSLLVNSAGAVVLTNGTIKFSGSYTYSNALFTVSPTVVSTAGIWLNNPNVTVSPKNYSYSLQGLIRVTQGAFNVGTSSGSSMYLLAGSNFTVEGGAVNVTGRLLADNAGGTSQGGVTYNQSAGVVSLLTVGSNSASLSGFEFDLSSDNFIMSGGTIILTNEDCSTCAVELYNRATTTITGGTIQFASATSSNVTANGFFVNSTTTLPSIYVDNTAGLGTLVRLYNNLTVTGSITIDVGATLSNSYDDAAHTLNIYDVFDIALTGDWTNNGTFDYWNSNKVTFNGGSAQLMTGGTITEFNRLTINNSSGGVTLQVPEIVDSLLTLSNGLVYSDLINVLIMYPNSSVAGVSNSSFVSGPVEKDGSTAFTFPVGKDLEYRPISISALTGTDAFTAEYFDVSPSASYNINLHVASINHVSNCEYWELDRLGFEDANVKLSWDTYSCGVTSLPNLTVAYWDGAQWTDDGNGGTTGNTTTGTVITSAPATLFGPFTLSSTNSSNPLPINLLNFDAVYNGSTAVNLNWSTATETNNDYFTIERTADLTNFTELNKVKGAGNSIETLYYNCKDVAPLNGVSYYRLKQTDYDGVSTYSNIKSVSIDNATTFEITGAMFSTKDNALNISFIGTPNANLSFQLYDIIGKKVFDSQATNVSGSVISLEVPALSKGIYLLKAVNGEIITSKKVMKN